MLVDAVVVNAVPVSTVVDCEGPGASCLLTYATRSTVTGDMEGGLQSAGALFADLTTGSYHTSLLALFRGTLAGCGVGSLAFSIPLVAGGPAPFTGRIDVIPDSGVDELAGVSGHGTVRITPSETTNTSEWKLRLRCTQQRTRSAHLWLVRLGDMGDHVEPGSKAVTYLVSDQRRRTPALP